jgi:hypothetical protein
MSIVSLLQKPFLYLFNRKLVLLLLVYSVVSTSSFAIFYFTNQKPRLSYLENTIRSQGLDYQDGRGVYCVVENGCYNFVQTRMLISNLLGMKDANSVNPFNAPGINYSYQPSSVIALPPDIVNNNISSQSYSNPYDNKTWPVYYGFVGGDKVKVELNSSMNDIKGNYFSTSENKTYKLAGRINSNVDTQTGYNGGGISMNEFENDSISGKMDIYSDKPQGINGGYNYGLPYEKLIGEPAKLKKLFGNYTSTDGIMYDLYLTQDEDEINNWKTETFTGKLLSNNSNWQTVFIKVGEKYYHTKNVNKFKDIPNESNVTFTAKTRPSYQQDYYSDKNSNCYAGGGPMCGQGFTSKDLLFGVGDVKAQN